MRVHEPYTIFARTLKSGRKVYYFRFRDENGVRSNAYSSGTDKLSVARRYCNKLYNEGKFKTLKAVNFETFASSVFADESTFITWKTANSNKMSPETIRSYRIKLEKQILPFFRSYNLTQIKTADVKKWIIWAMDSWSKKTVNNAQGVLSIIFEQAKEEGFIDINPVKGIQYRKIEKQKKVLLTVEEIKSILACRWSSPVQKLAFFTATLTGMRIGEVCGLMQENLHEDFLDVKYSLSTRNELGTTKTGINRIVPIPKELYKMLQENKKSSKWVFAENETDAILSHNVYNSFCRKCDKLGIDRKTRFITLHSMRNFFISYLQMNNITEAKIRAVVGHKDTTMTDVYTVWSKEMFQEVYNAQKKLFIQLKGEEE